MTYLYSHDTEPSNAAFISAERGEIVHIQCQSERDRVQYAEALARILDDNQESGGGYADLEITGLIDGDSVRIHLSVA